MPLDLQRPFEAIHIALLTVSDTRTLETDQSGDLLAERVQNAGHHLAARCLLKDDLSGLKAQLQQWAEDPQIDVIITTGGTGVAPRDVTPASPQRQRGGGRHLRLGIPFGILYV